MRADREQVARLLRTARGQIDGILKMVEEDRYCIDVSNQIMAAESILGRANREVLRAHLEGCVRDACENGAAEEKVAGTCLYRFASFPTSANTQNSSALTATMLAPAGVPNA